MFFGSPTIHARPIRTRTLMPGKLSSARKFNYGHVDKRPSHDQSCIVEPGQVAREVGLRPTEIVDYRN